MEDALALSIASLKLTSQQVLILVVMEDALALEIVETTIGENKICLNPCCNGRCTRTTHVLSLKKNSLPVLILVVMEDALARDEYFGGERQRMS